MDERARTAAMPVSETTFRSGGVDCAARVYRPDAPLGKPPCIVIANGFTLTRDVHCGVTLNTGRRSLVRAAIAQERRPPPRWARR